MLFGWYKHFKTLSSSSDSQSFDQVYHHLVLMDTNEIEDICHAQGQLSAQVTKEEVKKAIKELNKGKAADPMGITAEHFVYAEDSIMDSLCLILNKLFESGQVTDENWLNYTCIKKGSNIDSKNYRGITVIPIITKVLELVIRAR